MRLITEQISIQEIREEAKKTFGNLVKAVVDIKKGIMVIGAELHSDEEALLLEGGSRQQDLWGINLYPDIDIDDWIEFDSMINLRPSQNNYSRGIDDPQIRDVIIKVVNRLVKR